MKATLIVFLIFLTLSIEDSFGQTIEKVYLNPNDSSVNRYISVVPESNKGLLILIPSFGETPENVLVQTELPQLAAKGELLTVIPVLSTGITSIGIDSLSQHSLRMIVEDVAKRYKLDNAKVYIGGFSIGGSCAMRFAQLAVREKYKFTPNAVFAVDSPLDYERFYNSYKRSIRLARNTQPNQEALYMVNRIEEEMKGSPETSRQNYVYYSPYSFPDEQQTAIKYLIQIPVRYYTEPDINWWLKERGSDYSAMNALDGSCMINELTRLGNANATIIVTQSKGYRQPGNRRHPHSWSIVDAKELLQWLQKY